MSTYREVFGEILADHHEAPRNWGMTADADVKEHGYNPLCGDKIDIFLKKMPNEKLKISFEGEGCSICMASASIMSEKVNDTTRENTLAWIEAFRAKMQGKESENAESLALLPTEDSTDDLVALYGVKRFSVRIKCALLPWTTLKKAIEGLS